MHKFYNCDFARNLSMTKDMLLSYCSEGLKTEDNFTIYEQVTRIQDVIYNLLRDEDAVGAKKEIFNYLIQHYFQLPKNLDTFKNFCTYVEKMYCIEDKNFLYQQVMEYVRPYISLRELKDNEMLSGQRAMLMGHLDCFDEFLEEYYQAYEEAKEKQTEKINAYKFEVSQVTLDDDDLKTYVLRYYNEILVYLYTYLYIHHLEPDFRIIDEIEIEKVIQNILNGQKFTNIHYLVFDENLKKRDLITLVDNTKKKRKKSYQKRLMQVNERGHIYK